MAALVNLDFYFYNNYANGDLNCNEEKNEEPVMAAKSLVFWMNHISQVCSCVFLIPENIFDMIVITIFLDIGRAQSDLTRQGPRLTLGEQVGWGT